MSTTYRVSRAAGSVAVVLTLLICGASAPFAQGSRSAAAAKQLTDLLDRHKLDAIAAKDPDAPDRFVAALYFGGAQMLVVSAQYSVPVLMIEKLAAKDYRDVYIDLNSASVAGSKVFVIDQGADGLSARPEDSQVGDSWEQGGKSVSFDGDWRQAKLTEQEYMKTFATADEQYARMLTILADQAAKAGS
jgi:hypothetical protein